MKNKLTVTQGQLEYEFEHLQKKLFIRDRKKFENNLRIKEIEPNPLFKVVEGDIEDWERI